MFKNGLKKPLLEWLKKEAGEDWVEPNGSMYFYDSCSIRVDFGEFCIEMRLRETKIASRETYTGFFEDGASLSVREKIEPYTRARFRAALRRLKK